MSLHVGALVPPQSISVSPWFFLPSVALGASQMPVVHVERQSFESPHFWPAGQSLSGAAVPPQSIPVSPAFLRPSW